MPTTLILIRHGQAVERADWATQSLDDAERPLTERGAEKMLLQAKGLRSVVGSVDEIISSPFTRAAQTAAILAQVFKREVIHEEPLLASGSDAAPLFPRLLEEYPERTVALVGHEPDLSLLLGFLLTRRSDAFTSLKKGSAVVLEAQRVENQMQCILRHYLAPRILRQLAEG